MRNQTKIGELNGSRETASKSLSRHVGEFADSVLTLAELQARLLVADVKQCSRRALVPGLVLLCGVALGLACFPIALAALALLLVQVFEISYAAGFLVAAVGGAVLAAMLCVVGWFYFRERLPDLHRSRQELVRNLGWIKKVLKRKRITRENGVDNSWRTVT